MVRLLLTLMLAGTAGHAGCSRQGTAGMAQAADRTQVFVLALASAESFDRTLPVLRFAGQDVKRMQNVLKRMAQVPDQRITVLQDSSRTALRHAFTALADRMRAAGRPHETKFIFYYTGHSDTKGLHLADGLLGKDELNALLASIPANARIAFFDSCYAGGLATKGIKPAADFVVPRAEYDEPSGSVFLAATSGTDVAFELEELGGSLFTHHLVAGLYGAADANRDGLVTVDEVYHYVYQQMSSGAMSLPRGHLQKPEYAMRLHGKGALVLAEVKRATVPLQIDAELSGRLILSMDGGLQVFKIIKPEGQVMQMQLVPGDYRVTLEQDDNVGHGLLRVPSRGTTQLSRAQLVFEKAPRLALVAKGERPRPRWAVAMGVANSTYSRIGPRMEAELATRSATIEGLDWRFLINGGWQTNRLDYQNQSGHSQTLSFLAGARGSLWPAWALDGQDWRLLLAGGFDYVWQDWDAPSGVILRTFQPFIPKVAYGLGTSFTRPSGLTFGLNFRREFPFATGKETGDVFALGASVFAASVEW
ncbi:MAG TPA: caspase family protein [Oligoflexus sp.]|uniref:caspase family protein n=1 Tax=Oligoflexus sp. TaxID=1971216 RepID=UPI002D5FA19A|nr:caspase family protein [Oligoflexus sp.]HYX38102.1 caspase family protein [Oligoflexus sp.]